MSMLDYIGRDFHNLKKEVRAAIILLNVVCTMAFIVMLVLNVTHVAALNLLYIVLPVIIALANDLVLVTISTIKNLFVMHRDHKIEKHVGNRNVKQLLLENMLNEIFDSYKVNRDGCMIAYNVNGTKLTIISNRVGLVIGHYGKISNDIAEKIKELGFTSLEFEGVCSLLSTDKFSEEEINWLKNKDYDYIVDHLE